MYLIHALSELYRLQTNLFKSITELMEIFVIMGLFLFVFDTKISTRIHAMGIPKSIQSV